MNNRPSQVSGLGAQILQQLKEDLGPIWSERMSQADRALIEAVSNDAAAVLFEALAGGSQQAAMEKAQVDAQLLNISSAESAHVSRQLWESAGTVVKVALGIAIALA